MARGSAGARKYCGYCSWKTLRQASKIPFTKPPASSEEYFLASSTASLMTTLGGVSVARISCSARRRIAWSMTERRSRRQFAACFEINSSSAVKSCTAPSNNWFANVRVCCAALAPFQNFASSFAGSCWLISHWKSICMANSRDLVRRDTLGSPAFARVHRLRGATELPRKLRHLNGPEPRLKAFVAAFQARAIDGLLERFASQHAKHDGNPGVHLRELQTPRRFGADIIVMRGFAADNAPDGNQRIVFSGRREFFGRQWQFKRTRHMRHINVLAARARALQGIYRALQQPLGNEAVEPADNDPEAQTV